MATLAAQRAANRKPAKKPAQPSVPGPPIPLGRDEFRVFLLRPKKPNLEITDLGTAVSWSDDSPILSGDLAIQDPSLGKPTVAVSLGDEIMLQARSVATGAWAEVWRMRVKNTSTSIKAGSRAWTIADDLQNLADSTDDFRFVRGKGHKKGWTATQIIRAVCKRYGIKIGALPNTTYLIKSTVAKDASPLDVITDALRTDRVHTGRRYVMRFRRGKLFITPLVRSNLVYQMGPTIIEATYTLSKEAGFATMLTVRGSVHRVKGKDGKLHTIRKGAKLRVRVSRPSTTARFGVVHKKVTLKGADSVAEARKLGLAELDKRLRPKKEFTFTHPGIIGLRRGQAMRIRTADIAQVAWVTGIRHSVGAGDYTMEVTVTFSDPFTLTRAERLAAARAKAAAAKGRKSDKGAKKTKPKPKLATVRRA